MALGTITAVTQSGQAPGNAQFKDIVTVVLDNSYPTGGYPGLQDKLRSLPGRQGRTIVSVKALDAAGYLVGWDAANSKLKLYHFDYDAVADGAAIQVPDTTAIGSPTLSLEIESV